MLNIKSTCPTFFSSFFFPIFFFLFLYFYTWYFKVILIYIFVVILQESFDPIVDAVTGRDLIPSMVYG